MRIKAVARAWDCSRLVRPMGVTCRRRSWSTQSAWMNWVQSSSPDTSSVRIASSVEKGAEGRPAMAKSPGSASCRKAISLEGGPPGRQKTGVSLMNPKAAALPGPMRTRRKRSSRPMSRSTLTVRSRSLFQAPPLVISTSETSTARRAASRMASASSGAIRQEHSILNCLSQERRVTMLLA